LKEIFLLIYVKKEEESAKAEGTEAQNKGKVKR
jgi:hypothetical protein